MFKFIIYGFKTHSYLLKSYSYHNINLEYKTEDEVLPHVKKEGQAFFPYSTNIDKMDYTNPLLGTAKALSIRNAIPIYNEAFDYQANVGVNSIVGL